MPGRGPSPTITRGTDKAGAGTTAARSRAMATMSLITATAVASPPAPAPLIATSPACTPEMTAAFCGPTVRANTEPRGTTVGATHAVSAARSWSYSACAS